MLVNRFQRALQIAKPDQRWRRDLFALRKLVDQGLDKRAGLSGVTSRLGDNLLSALKENPQAARPAARQLRRVGRYSEALEAIEDLWAKQAPNSAAWCLACAQVWYDAGYTWRGDEALAHGFALDPESVDLFKEVARNRRERGNMAPSIEAASRILELDPSARHDREWDELVGIQFYEARQFHEAAPYLARLVVGSTSWLDYYHLAVTQEETGDRAGADASYQEAARRRPLELSAELAVPELHSAAGDVTRAVAALTAASASSAKVEAQRRRLLVESLLRLEKPDEAVAAARGRDSSLAGLTGLALELKGDIAAAVVSYDEALSQVKPRRTAQLRELTLRRQYARSARALGDNATALRVWSEADSRHFKLTGLEAEASPHYTELVKDAAALLSASDFGAAIPVLEQLAVSSSTRVNNSRVQWNLGVALARVGRESDALEAFSRGTEMPLPHPLEARDTPPRASRAELYAERRETLNLDHSVVLYESFHGAKTACNPLALCQSLRRTRPDLHHVWAIRDGATIHPDLLRDPRVSFVRIHSDGYYRHLATAATLVNNTTFPPGYVRREGQRYINTWHGVPWKRLGREVPGDAFAFGNVARNLLQATDLVVPNQHTARVLLETQDVADVAAARVHITGQPRIDVSMNMTHAERDALRSMLGIGVGLRVVFYAPTWRGASDTVREDTAVFMGAVKRLASAPGVHVVVRVHHFLSAELEGGELPENVSIAPEDVDTNELLGMADVLVSDYSSLIFDYAPLNRPIIKYVYDFEEYARTRGLYFNLDDVPGISVRTEDDLLAALNDAPRVMDWAGSPTVELWAQEDGHATARVLETMLASDGEPEFAPSDRIALNVVSLNPNGITRSLRNLLATAPNISARARLVLPHAALRNTSNASIAEEVHERVDFTMLMSATIATRRENYAWYRLRVFREPLTEYALEQVTSLMQRERRRHFAGVRFATAVDFDGYGLYQTALVGLGFPEETRTVSVLHNEFEMERNVRFPVLAATGQLLDHFDSLPSVSESVMQANREALALQYGVPRERHVELPNTINPALIRELGTEQLDTDVADWMQQSGIHVVVAGRLSTEKNHQGFLRALAEFSRSNTSAVFATFLGDGPKSGELKALASKLGLRDRVLFAGYRANPYPVINKADVLFVSSTHEGQSLVALEAMTLGTPVVSTDIPGPASVLQGGKLGLLVPPTVEGMVTGLTRIVSGTIVGAEDFDAEAYLNTARAALEDVIDGPR